MVKSVESIKNIERLKEAFDAIAAEVGRYVVGQQDVLRQFIAAILCNANALVEGYPGLAKTLMVKTLAQTMDLKFSRIQNTPDLMPSDITGTYVIEESSGKKTFKFQPGPLFANIVLADEINRATPKTQSALLEAMQEKQVTVGNNTFILEKPFFVLATQNPIEQEGTYPLPEAQVDRFLFKINITYPTYEEELEIVEKYTKSESDSKPKVLLSANGINVLQELVRQVPIADDIKRKAVSIVTATRMNKSLIQFGASPRASIGLILAAKARAIIDGRKFVSIKDIREMAYPVLRHRIILNFEAEREGKTPDDIIKAIIDKVG